MSPRSVWTVSPSRSLDLGDLEAGVAALLPQLAAELAVVERAPAPRQPVAGRAVRRVEGHAGELLADRAAHAHRVQPRPSARRRRRWRARRSRSGRRRARRRRTPASSRATASPAKLAPQISTSGARVAERRALGAAQRGAAGHGRSAPNGERRQPPDAHAHAAAEHVVAGGLDAVEHRLVDRAGEPDPRAARRPARRPRPGRRRRTGGASGRPRARPARAARGEALGRAEVGLGDAEALAVLERQVDAVQPVVLGDVADEVGVLEREPEPAVVGVMALGDAEQRRHDPPDRAGRALHVGDELLPAADPHRRAVDPHRAHVRGQLRQRQVVAARRVDERSHHRVRRAALVAGRGPARPPRRPARRGAPRGSARGAGRRRAGRPCARSRRARGWRAGRPRAGVAWPSSTSGRGAGACGGRCRRRR